MLQRGTKIISKLRGVVGFLRYAHIYNVQHPEDGIQGQTVLL